MDCDGKPLRSLDLETWSVVSDARLYALRYRRDGIVKHSDHRPRYRVLLMLRQLVH